MGDSTLPQARRDRPRKPHRDFPLFAHRNGQWAKKIRQKLHYFGRWSDDPKGVRALQLWLQQKDDLLAGRQPRDATDALVIRDLCNRFLTDKETKRDNGELSPRTFLTYYGMCSEVVETFGRNRPISDLTPDDFRLLRTKLASTRGLVALGNAIQRVRSLFKFAYDEGLIPTPTRYGQAFTKPRKERIAAEREAHRAKHGRQMFEAAEIRLMLTALEGNKVAVKKKNYAAAPSTIQLKPNRALRAMVLLSANCAFGQTDLASLPTRAVDLKTGWIDFGRGKTGVSRRIPIWPETCLAIRSWLAVRPSAKDPADEDFLFLTKSGARFLRLNSNGYHIDGIGQEFQKLISRLGIKRPRLGLYSFRHGFETIAGETGDQVAVDAIMGHKDSSMASHYREGISDKRLSAVVNAVRKWLFAPKPR